jgi:hypothetical protein
MSTKPQGPKLGQKREASKSTDKSADNKGGPDKNALYAKKKKKTNTGSGFEVMRADGTIKGKQNVEQKKRGGKGGEKKVYDKGYSQKSKDGQKKNQSKDGKPELSNSQKRHQRDRVSEMVKKLRLNYNKLLMQKSEIKLTKMEREQIVGECLEIIGDKFNELVLKHDGCRILQALIKYGTKEQKLSTITKLKDEFSTFVS